MVSSSPVRPNDVPDFVPPQYADTSLLGQAYSYAAPLLENRRLDSGESVFEHAHAVARIVHSMGADIDTQAVAYLMYACEHLLKPEQTLSEHFGAPIAALALQTHRLMQVQRRAKLDNRLPGVAGSDGALDILHNIENVRKIFLAYAQDMRVVLLRLASRLQSLRYYAHSKKTCPTHFAREALHIYATLANRLGLAHLKWEIEDLAFRFLEPACYKDIAGKLEAKRSQREAQTQAWVTEFSLALQAQGIHASVVGRPKHIYSIVKKMRSKNLDFSQLMDIYALRVLVQTTDDCYRVLSWLHAHFRPIDGEFDDYIARPKANGYQSIHSVVTAPKTKGPLEVQIRTYAMQEQAEHGAAAHWAYKEASPRGQTGATGKGNRAIGSGSASQKTGKDYEKKIAILRQLLDWEREIRHQPETRQALQAMQQSAARILQDRIYVFTPNAAVVELPQGATPIDFAYAVHTQLGHRCRGAKINGQICTLNTPLQNGQTVEISVAKNDAPSRDWLNPSLGYLASARAKSKVRAWFNSQQNSDNQSDVSSPTPRSNPAPKTQPAVPATAAPPAGTAVLVQGIDALLTQLAGCCKPLPPDPLAGYITKGQGVRVHRLHCPTMQSLRARQPGRCVEVTWAEAALQHRDNTERTTYPAEILLETKGLPQLLRDIGDVLAREKIRILALRSVAAKAKTPIHAEQVLRLTVALPHAQALRRTITQLGKLNGVYSAKRV